MTAETTSSERRALLERRANVRVERLGRLVGAIERRRVLLTHELKVLAALAGGGLFILGVLMGAVYVRRMGYALSPRSRARG